VSDEQERPRFFVAGRPLLPLGEAVGQIEEVIPVNVSTWVLLSEVTVGQVPGSGVAADPSRALFRRVVLLG